MEIVVIVIAIGLMVLGCFVAALAFMVLIAFISPAIEAAIYFAEDLGKNIFGG